MLDKYQGKCSLSSVGLFIAFDILSVSIRLKTTNYFYFHAITSKQLCTLR